MRILETESVSMPSVAPAGRTLSLAQDTSVVTGQRIYFYLLFWDKLKHKLGTWPNHMGFSFCFEIHLE